MDTELRRKNTLGQYSHPILPCFSAQTLHLVKMLITANKRQIMLQGKSGNPDIILGNGTSLLSQFIFDLTVPLCGPDIATENHTLGSQFVHPRQVGLDAPRFRAVIQFADYDAGEEYLVSPLICSTTTASLANKAMTILVSNKYLPLMPVHLLAIVLDGLMNQLQVVRWNHTGKAQQFFTGNAALCKSCQLFDIIQYLPAAG